MAQGTGRRFEGRGVVISGAASGIGLATVIRLAEEGAALACVDRDGDGATAAAEIATDLGSDAFALACDVADESQVVSTIALAVEQLGKLDSIVNMAGILGASHTDEMPLDDWNRILTVNLTGTFLMCREAIPHLLETGGNIVNAASTSALAGHPWFAAYGASKAGVLMMTRTIAVEYGKRGMRANTVAPGGVGTPMTDSARLPDDIDWDLLSRITPLDQFRGPETVASAIAFLASEDAAHVNGESIRCDGATLA